MIKEVTMYSVVCDVCEITYIDDYRGYSAMGDPGTIAEWAIDSGWHIDQTSEPPRCYCPSCYQLLATVDKDGL